MYEYFKDMLYWLTRLGLLYDRQYLWTQLIWVCQNTFVVLYLLEDCKPFVLFSIV